MPVLTEQLARLRGHRWQISCLSFDPSGSVLASGGWDKEVHLWNLASLERSLTLKNVHDTPITSVSWHRPNGTILCTGSADCTAALWDAQNGRHLSTLYEHDGWVLGTSFSSSGSLLATASWDRSVRLWDLESQSVINTLNGHKKGVWSVDFNPRLGSMVLCSSSEDGTVCLWDARTNKPVHLFSAGHTDAVYCAKWSSNGSLLASGSADTKVCVWEPSKGALINTIYGHVDTVKSVVFNPRTDNVAVPILASAGDFTLRLSDPRPSQRADILTLKPQSQGKEVEAIAISPDGSLLVSGGRDGLVVLFNLLVPTIMPRSESSTYSSSSFVRKSRALHDRSYIHDAINEDVDNFEEEEDIEAEIEAEALDDILTQPKKAPKKQTSFTRLKRRSRVEEKETELSSHATVRKKGRDAKLSRGKRIVGKQFDIPTMVAHLSATVRAYGPEDPSSSESDEEHQKQDATGITTTLAVATKVAAFSSPQAFANTTSEVEKPSSDLDLHRIRRQFENPISPSDQTEQEYLNLSWSNEMPSELENTVPHGGFADSTNMDAQSLIHQSGHYTIDSLTHTLDSSQEFGKRLRGEQSFQPYLPPPQEYEESYDDYDEEEDAISMI